MNIENLDTARAVTLFGWHNVHGPSEVVLKIPAGTENYARMSLDTTGRIPTARYQEPDERGGCFTLAERIKSRNWPCHLELPNQNVQRCYVISKKGSIVVKKEDLAGLTLAFNWSLLPRLRVGYLVEFTDDTMTVSSEPPEGATDEELAALLWIRTDTTYGQYLEHISGVKTQVESYKRPVDWRRVIRPTPLPGKAKLRPLPDDYNESMAALDLIERQIENHPGYRRRKR